MVSIFFLGQNASSSGTTLSGASTQFPESDISEVMKLGFSREQVIEELRRFNGDKNQAMAALFAKSFQVPK